MFGLNRGELDVDLCQEGGLYLDSTHCQELCKNQILSRSLSSQIKNQSTRIFNTLDAHLPLGWPTCLLNHLLYTTGIRKGSQILIKLIRGLKFKGTLNFDFLISLY